MAKNKPFGDKQRKGAAARRSQALNPKTGRYDRRETYKSVKNFLILSEDLTMLPTML